MDFVIRRWLEGRKRRINFFFFFKKKWDQFFCYFFSYLLKKLVYLVGVGAWEKVTLFCKGCNILGEIMCLFVRGNLMLRGCLQKAKREVMWKIRLTIMWQWYILIVFMSKEGTGEQFVLDILFRERVFELEGFSFDLFRVFFLYEY